MQVKDFEKRFKDGTAFPTDQAPNLVGRILRGIKPVDFRTMTNEPEKRKVIQLMDGQGLAELVGRSTRDQLLHIGYDSDYIKSLVESGHIFKLVVFEQDGSPAKRAWWKEVLEVCGQAWPELSKDFTDALPHLRRWPFEFWEAQLKISTNGLTFKDIKKDVNHPFHMTAARLASMSVKTPLSIRTFLYLNAFLTELFSGDGFTWNERNERGLPEYIAPNREISTIPSAIIIDLPKP